MPHTSSGAGAAIRLPVRQFRIALSEVALLLAGDRQEWRSAAGGAEYRDHAGKTAPPGAGHVQTATVTALEGRWLDPGPLRLGFHETD